MLLEIDNSELLLLLESPESLHCKNPPTSLTFGFDSCLSLELLVIYVLSLPCHHHIHKRHPPWAITFKFDDKALQRQFNRQSKKQSLSCKHTRSLNPPIRAAQQPFSSDQEQQRAMRTEDVDPCPGQGTGIRSCEFGFVVAV
uniref:Uncharacterized protein n=1 Tax=Sphaerodactylus townsendi TaxID=933632 RepID=A0ACB8F661_9SAUR